MTSITRCFTKNLNLNKLDISQNIDLICIKVNSEQLNSTPLDWIKDSNSIYSLNCSENERTYIPDENFEKDFNISW